MQPVGLALPELHHLRVQDVAAPSRRSGGFVLWAFFQQDPIPGPPAPIPGPLEGSCWDASAEDQVSLTSMLALAPLALGRAASVPRFSFSDTVQGKETEEGPDQSVLHIITIY